eukprot:9586285-Lingulodinium_polyedra.AAC.1
MEWPGPRDAEASQAVAPTRCPRWPSRCWSGPAWPASRRQVAIWILLLFPPMPIALCSPRRT